MYGIFNSAVDTLQTIVIGLGGALCVWGGVNLLEGYGRITRHPNRRASSSLSREVGLP